jgi:hypothetical protein
MLNNLIQLVPSEKPFYLQDSSLASLSGAFSHSYQAILDYISQFKQALEQVESLEIKVSLENFARNLRTKEQAGEKLEYLKDSLLRGDVPLAFDHPVVQCVARLEQGAQKIPKRCHENTDTDINRFIEIKVLPYFQSMHESKQTTNAHSFFGSRSRAEGGSSFQEEQEQSNLASELDAEKQSKNETCKTSWY